jgi:peptidyl-prolyl cis-trans isomerase C
MKRTLVSIALLAVVAAVSAPLSAQSAAPTTAATPIPAASAATPDPIVAIVNGEAITRQTLDGLWERMSPKMKLQYERVGGGKLGFLNNYVSKVLMLQEARRAGFDKKSAVLAEINAARDSALFDAYVRDTIAPTVVTDADVKAFYEEHLPDFTSEQANLAIIRIAKGASVTEARARISAIMNDLIAARTALGKDGKHIRELRDAFNKVAQQVSEDPSAGNGGELGWVERGRLPVQLEQAAFSMSPLNISGVIEMDDAFALLYLSERASRTEPLEEVAGTLREYLLGRKQREVAEAINKKTAGLQGSARVETFPRNIE